jgi:hypothetical protein
MLDDKAEGGKGVGFLFMIRQKHFISRFHMPFLIRSEPYQRIILFETLFKKVILIRSFKSTVQGTVSQIVRICVPAPHQGAVW